MDKKQEEREFLEHFNRASLQDKEVAGVIGIVMYDLYAIADWITSPNNYKSLWLIRLGVTAIWGVTMLVLTTEFGRKNIRQLTFAMAVLGSLSVVYIWSLAFPDKLPREISGLVVTMLYCITALRMLRREAIIYTAIFIGSFALLLYSRDSSKGIWLGYMVNFAAVFSIAYAASVLMERYARRAHQDEKKMREEQARADNLLHKTFPEDVAIQLKSNHGTIAKRANNVTVMFCDIVGFTAASANLEPEILVHWLNETFSTFDRLATENGCEKIKTIGDAYMAVSGVPNETHDHAERIVRLALSITENVKMLNLDGNKISVRIGIHSGPVVAGVIGESRFAYDLWGDTVNTASRMEALAPAGAIQITKETLEATAGKFKTEKQAPIAVKGKGLMETWLVTGIQETAGNTAPEAAEKTAQEAAA